MGFVKGICSTSEIQKNGIGDTTAASSLRRLDKQVERNSALDFTKGVLVLFMVLYHWLNYFVSRQGEFYKYLRFITPSFIFITGFLIANVYLEKYAIGDPRLHKRLIIRGSKLLLLFTILNLSLSLSGVRMHMGMLGGVKSFLRAAPAIYLSGNGGAAAFSILVPISYLLLASSLLLLPCKWNKCFFHAVCVFSVLSIYILYLNGTGSSYLELFTMGLFGIVVGMLPIQRINWFARYLASVIIAYVAYVILLTIWKEIYPLQVVGVFLSLLLIYAVGLRIEENGWGQSQMVELLGKYSLLAYIVQIGVVLVLSKTLTRFNLGKAVFLISFVAVFSVTIAAVACVGFARSKSHGVDRLYRFVFA